MKSRGFLAETRENGNTRFARRATYAGIVFWAVQAWQTKYAEIRVTDQTGREIGHMTYGGFWMNVTDPKLSAAIDRFYEEH